MSFDGFFTTHMMKELHPILINGRVSKIHHPINEELVFTIRSNGKNHKLLINISAQSQRLQLTENVFKNPDTPTNFCMVLRKHLEGSKLTAIQQVGMDRIVTFIFQGNTEIGDIKQYHLTIELMGKHSNVFLVNPQTNQIIDCMKHIPLYKNTHRTILPNAQYVLPPQQHKINPKAQSLEQLTGYISNDASPKTIQATFQGLSLQTIHAILDLKHIQNSTIHQALWHYLNTSTQPVIQDNVFFAVNPTGKGHSYATLSQMLDTYYATQAVRDRLNALTHTIKQKLNAILLRNTLKLDKIKSEMIHAQNSDDLRIKGELLTANSYRIQRGETYVTLENFYDNYHPITIALKPEKNATQNAKDYFKKYQKLKQSLQHLTQQLEQTQLENNYLESVLVQLEHANLSDIEDIRLELLVSGYLKEKDVTKKTKLSKQGPLVFRSLDGTTILVGRNNMQNDHLTLKQSRKDFIWLHAKDIPGSHVIIQHASPSNETLQLAGELAAYYSKFKLSSNVPVDYVAIQHIKKPNGAKPGYVIYAHQKTMLVTPNEDKLFTHQLVE